MKLNYFLLNQKMQQNGFAPIQNNLQGMLLYGCVKEEHMYLCCLMGPMEDWQITHEQLKDISFQVERKFLFQGYRQVDFLYIVMSDNPEEDRKLIGEGYKMWLVNLYTNQIMKFENQPESFLGIEKVIIQTLMEKKTKNRVSTSSQAINQQPIVSVCLMAINIFIFLYMEMHGSTYDLEYLLQWGAKESHRVMEQQEYYRLFTSMFLHHGFEHLFYNMISLYFYGSIVERYIPKIRYLVFYILCGFAGSVVSVLYYYNFMPDKSVVSVGASGAIFGVLGILVGMVCASRGKIEGLSPTYVVIMSILVLYSGLQDESVNIVAHAGGFVMGVILGSINQLQIWKK